MTHDHRAMERYFVFIILHNSQKFVGVVRHIRNDDSAVTFVYFKFCSKIAWIYDLSVIFFCIRTTRTHIQHMFKHATSQFVRCFLSAQRNLVYNFCKANFMWTQVKLWTIPDINEKKQKFSRKDNQ